jgi:hypothetical protein
MRTQPAGAGAYPGTLLVYADVPTSGLPKSDAKAYARLLSFAAGPGQTAGSNTGQLPPGYLPMTAANGMGGMATYTAAAATDVGAQNGAVPRLDGSQPSPGSPTASGHGTSPASGSQPNGSSGTGVNGAPSASPSAAATKPSGSATVAPVASPVRAAPVAATVGERSGLLSVILGVLLGLVMLGPVAAPITLFVSRRGSRA